MLIKTDNRKFNSSIFTLIPLLILSKSIESSKIVEIRDKIYVWMKTNQKVICLWQLWSGLTNNHYVLCRFQFCFQMSRIFQCDWWWTCIFLHIIDDTSWISWTIVVGWHFTVTENFKGRITADAIFGADIFTSFCTVNLKI